MNHQTNPASVYTVSEARAAVIAQTPITSDTISLPIASALGRVAAHDIHATESIPPFRNSAMDGFAMRFEDIEHSNKLDIAGKSLAGHPFTGTIPHGGAVTITTGAMMPPGTDTIVIKENATLSGSRLTINQAPVRHQYVRNAGDDIQKNALLIAACTRLSPAHLGLLAAQGRTQVSVFRQPRIGVFSTGDELCDAGQNRFEGAIYDSNRLSICSMLRNAGYLADDLGITRDDQSDIQTLLSRHQQHYDFLLSSGGVSVGEADFVKAALEENGTLQFWKVAMKPGKPMVTGRLQSGTYYFGLPGNPVSSMVTCVQFVIPALKTFEGQLFQSPTTVSAVCKDTLTKEAGRFEFQRGVYEVDESGNLQVTTTGMQDSHVLHSMAQANCFICLEAESTGIQAGQPVKVMLFQSLSGLAE